MSVVECREYPGFYEIPGFSRYCISRSGVVVDKRTREILQGRIKFPSYIDFTMIEDSGKRRPQGRHRALALAFIPEERDVRGLHVNHINGVPGDDRLENLEWVTPKENIYHAGRMGLTSKCRPMETKDVRTGEVLRFDSAINCARAFGVPKDNILWRLKQPRDRVFPDGRQYRFGHSDDPWDTPEDIEKAIDSFGGHHPLCVKNLDTGEESIFPNIQKAADHIGIPLVSLAQIARTHEQAVVPGPYQIKKDKNLPWKDVIDARLEIAKRRGHKPVKVTNTQTGEVTIYASAKECADARGVLTTTLNWRLKTNGKVTYHDNCTYQYLEDSTTPQSSMSVMT